MNSPIPSDVTSECRKAAKIIEQFVKPDKKGIDQIIPPHIIAQAKGIAILSVLKAGFLFSGRGGSGLVVARLDDGSWSAPSAIGTAGFGAGGQIGVELTDFVIILNTKEAVKAFSHGGNVTLGGNLSVAAGPIGRNAEAAGTIGNLAAIFSYSKTRGLFVGVSIEGSVIVERKETNAAFYRRKVSAKEILSGSVPPPPAAEELYRALNRRTNYETGDGYDGDDGVYRSPTTSSSSYRQWPDNNSNSHNGSTFDRKPTTSSYAPSRPAPPPPTRSPAASSQDRVVALYDFNGERDGDLSFSRGDVITVVKRNANEWWVGRLNGREGVFPANYVEAQ
ncbi:hypothetical protein DFJ73DRAFT_815267 [Zopfochytrium polystomum]|nr:hypothetical protein DFJ73DRAFT_815267 [Zopfochytrium polystomum]